MAIQTGPGSEHADDALALRMRALLERAPLAMAFVRGAQFEVVSEHLNHLFGHGEVTDLSGQATRVAHVSDVAHDALLQRLSAAFGDGRPVDEEIEYVRRDGSRFWGRLQATPVSWDAPQDEALWIIEDITAARQARMQLTWEGKHDPITELANRREFERRLADRVGSRRNEPVSMLWVDLDKFMEVNARMGTEATDHFLYVLGQLLVAKVRASDLVARLEKDHFAVLLPDCDQHYAQLVGEKLRAAVAGYRLRWGVQSTRMKTCVGVVQLHASLPDVEAVLAAAAQACAEAKTAGGDSVRVFTPTIAGSGEPASSGA
jgi:diguanylate cyclase (GGDEF)-like protein/PAS domain S-box-containing protein